MNGVRVRTHKHARPRLCELLLDKPNPLSVPVELFYEEIREPGYPVAHFRHEDDEQAANLRVDALDLQRKGKRALQILLAYLAFVAFVAVAGLIGGSDRETLRQQNLARMEP